MAAKNKTYVFGKSRKLLEEAGFIVCKTEYWVEPKGDMPFGRRKDLFGIVDAVAVSYRGEPEEIKIQITTASNSAAREKKSRAALWGVVETKETIPVLIHILKAGTRFQVHGWRKNAAGKWTLRIREAFLREDEQDVIFAESYIRPDQGLFGGGFEGGEDRSV